MAVNHSRALQQASQEVLDSYVRALVNSVVKLQEAVSTVNEIFQPIDEGINAIQGGLQVLFSTSSLTTSYIFHNLNCKACCEIQVGSC